MKWNRIGEVGLISAISHVIILTPRLRTDDIQTSVGVIMISDPLQKALYLYSCFAQIGTMEARPPENLTEKTAIKREGGTPKTDLSQNPSMSTLRTLHENLFVHGFCIFGVNQIEQLQFHFLIWRCHFLSPWQFSI